MYNKVTQLLAALILSSMCLTSVAAEQASFMHLGARARAEISRAFHQLPSSFSEKNREVCKSIIAEQQMVSVGNFISLYTELKRYESLQVAVDACKAIVRSLTCRVVEWSDKPGDYSYIYQCHDAPLNPYALKGIRPDLTDEARARPDQRALVVGSLFVSRGMCVSGDITFEGDVVFDGDLLLGAGDVLYTNAIDSVEPGNVVTLGADLCIQDDKKILVNRIAPKSGSDATLFEGNVELASGKDLTINGRLIIPGELVVSATQDVLIGQGNCLFAECIKPLAASGEIRLAGDVCLLPSFTLNVNDIDSKTSAGITLHDSLCVVPTNSLKTNWILASSGNEVALGSDLRFDPTRTVHVNTVTPSTGGVVSIQGDLCVDETQTLRVNHIDSKTGAGISLNDSLCVVPTNSLKANWILASSGNEVALGSDLRVDPTKVVHANTVAPSTGGVVSIQGDLCVDETQTLRANHIDSKTGAGISIDDSLCVVPTSSVKTNWVQAQSGGKINVGDDLCVDSTNTLYADWIQAKGSKISLGSDVYIDATRTLSVNTIASTTGGSVTVNADLSIPVGKQLLVAGSPILSNPLQGSLELNGNNINSGGTINAVNVNVGGTLNVGVFRAFNNMVTIGEFGIPQLEVKGSDPDVSIAIRGDELTLNNSHLVLNASSIELSNSYVIFDGLDHYRSVGASDRRIKSNVTHIDAAESLQKILMLEPIRYEYIPEFLERYTQETGSQRGFIAQDVETLFPELVRTREKYELGDEELENFKFIEYSKLVVDLVAALQQSYSELGNLKGVVTQLKDEQEQAAHEIFLLKQYVAALEFDSEEQL